MEGIEKGKGREGRRVKGSKNRAFASASPNAKGAKRWEVRTI